MLTDYILTGAYKVTDTERLNMLELWANRTGGIHLHDGSHKGCLGIGLRPGNMVRTLREAIDQCAEINRVNRVVADASASQSSPGSAPREHP